MSLIICISIWILYALIEGYREAWYYYYRNDTTPVIGENLHAIFTAQRSIVAAILMWIFIGQNIVELYSGFVLNDLLIVLGRSVLFAGSLILIFPFFHDGMYYTQYNNINPYVYPKRWWDESTTSEAKTELSLTNRIIWLSIGVILIFISYFLD